MMSFVKKKLFLAGLVRPLKISIVSIRNSVKADREKWAFTGGIAHKTSFSCISAHQERINEPNLTNSQVHGPAGIRLNKRCLETAVFVTLFYRKFVSYLLTVWRSQFRQIQQEQNNPVQKFYFSSRYFGRRV